MEVQSSRLISSLVACGVIAATHINPVYGAEGKAKASNRMIEEVMVVAQKREEKCKIFPFQFKRFRQIG